MGQVTDERSLIASCEEQLARTLASLEPLGELATDDGRVIHRARGSMYVAFGVMKTLLEAGHEHGPEGCAIATSACLRVLDWVRECNDPIVTAMRGMPADRLQRFAISLGITTQGLTQSQLFDVLDGYFKAHAKPPGDAPS